MQKLTLNYFSPKSYSIDALQKASLKYNLFTILQNIAIDGSLNHPDEQVRALFAGNLVLLQGHNNSMVRRKSSELSRKF